MMVIVVVPSYSGIDGVFQFVVPVAEPLAEADVDQVMEDIPTGSEAVPFRTIVSLPVYTVVVNGEVMSSVGGVALAGFVPVGAGVGVGAGDGFTVGGLGAGGVGGAGAVLAVRSTVTTCVT